MQILSKIPESETIQVQHVINNIVKYITTRHKYHTDKFFFYEIHDDNLIKTEHVSDNPLDFQQYAV